jgi:DNA-binding phage protein
MTTYPKTLLTDAVYSNEPLRPFQISYFGERYRNRLHTEILKLFQKAQQERGLTKADLSRRLNKRPEQITRWLSAPGNWTLDTVSELMLAMGYEPQVGSQLLSENALVEPWGPGPEHPLGELG